MDRLRINGLYWKARGRDIDQGPLGPESAYSLDVDVVLLMLFNARINLICFFWRGRLQGETNRGKGMVSVSSLGVVKW